MDRKLFHSQIITIRGINLLENKLRVFVISENTKDTKFHPRNKTFNFCVIKIKL